MGKSRSFGQDAGTPERTICILLGSCEYPRDPPNNKSFMRDGLLKSYEDFLAYVKSPNGMSLSSANICDLFGSDQNFIEQHEKISTFLDGALSKLGSDQPIDLIIFFWGHGYYAGRQFHLALKHYTPGQERTTGYPIETLADIIQQKANSIRRYWLLDCCYADGALSAALDATTSVDKHDKATGDIVKEILASEFALPTSGSTALTAADRDNKAWVFRKDSRSLFTDLLMTALSSEDGERNAALSFQEVESRMQSILRDRLANKARYPDYHDRIIAPRCADPDRAEGVLSKLPIFRRHISSEVAPHRAATELLALGPQQMACLLVEAEGKSVEFEVEAKNALIEHQAELARVASKEFDAEQNTKSLRIESAFQDWNTILENIKAVCRADLAVFDVTGFQPGVMLLLGIRSVVRRGVTICSIDSPEVEAYRAKLPYCLQLLNVCSHSLHSSENITTQPRETIARKAIDGLRNLQANPYYLDLPAFEAVRRFGVVPEDYRPVPYDREVLFLCPFSNEYLKACWDASISRVFKTRLIAHHNKLPGRRQDTIRPELRRLLDRRSPQIVSQSLYEAVRRTQMCVVDWTNLRPNLFFEMGVRLACNPLGAVHIVADGKLAPSAAFHVLETGATWGTWPCDPENAPEVLEHASLRHTAGMRSLFNPIGYSVASTSSASYDKMLERYFASAGATGTDDARIYNAIGQSISESDDGRSQRDVARELIESAALLGSNDAFNNFSTVLHSDVSSKIRGASEAAALERKLAAWLYMYTRHGAEQIARDPARYLDFQDLYLDIVQNGKSQFSESLLSTVTSGYGDVATYRPIPPNEPFPLLEKSVGNFIKISKLAKDRKDYQGAMAELKIAVELIDTSLWQINSRNRSAQSPEHKRAATMLTDLFGMMGGHLRRMGQMKDAQERFALGKVIETNSVFEIESTYNLVNWLVTSLELEPERYLDFVDDVDAVLGLLGRHTQGARNQDGWAWADLGTCLTFSRRDGDIERAKEAFARFIQLTHREAIGSPLSVLVTIDKALKRVGAPLHEKTTEAISYLQAQIAMER